jgi:tetratricopeptide (TPR) repeat protein
MSFTDLDIKKLEKIVENNPKNEKALVDLARAYQDHDPSNLKISKLLKSALELNKSNPYTLFTLGCYYSKRQTFKPAIKYFELTLKLEERHSGAAYNLGVCFDSLGDFSKSIEFYSLSLQLDPSNTKAKSNKAVALDKSGKSSEARELFEELLPLDSSAMTLNNYAVCLKKLQESELALKFFLQACEKTPEHSVAFYNLAVFLSENNEVEKSLDYYKKCLQLDRSHVFGCLASANSLESQEKFYSALKVFEVILEVIPDLSGVPEKILVIKKRLAGIEELQRLPKNTENLKSFEKNWKKLENLENLEFHQLDENQCLEILANNSASCPAHLKLAVLLCERSDFLKAKQHLNQVLVLNPGFHPEVTFDKLGEIFFRKEKDFSKAKEAFLKAANVKPNAEIWVRCGKCAQKMKDFQEASNFYLKALECDPKAISALFRLGWALIKLGKREEGLEKIEKGYKLDPNNPQILTKYAEILIRDGNSLERALELLQNSLKIDSDLPETFISLSKCYERLERHDEAIQSLEKAILLPKVPISAYFHLACLLEKSDKSRAISLYKQCISLEKTFLAAWLHLATLLANSGETKKAKKYFREVLQLDAENVSAHFSLGKIFQSDMENFEEAVRHFEIVISVDKNHYKACCQLGILYMDKGDHKRAIEYLSQSIDLNPKYNLSRVSIATVYFDRGNLKDSIKHFKEAIKLSPNDIQALVGLGNAYFKLKKPGDSIKFYTQALKIDPNLSETHFNLGNSYYLKQDIDQAISSYKKSLELNPNKAETHYNLANALTVKNNFSQAILEFKQSIRLDPNNPDAYYNMANAYYFIDEYNEAIRNYQEAIQLGLKSPEGHFNLGLVYFRIEKFDLALEEFRSSFEIENGNHEILYYLGFTLYKLGNSTDAKGYLLRCLEIRPEYSQAKELLQKIS